MGQVDQDHKDHQQDDQLGHAPPSTRGGQMGNLCRVETLDFLLVSLTSSIVAKKQEEEKLEKERGQSP